MNTFIQRIKFNGMLAIKTQKSLDPWICLGCFSLAVIGLMSIYSAGNGSQTLFFKQFTRIFIALSAMLIAAHIPPRIWYRYSPWMYAVSLVLLIVVLILGHIGKGAQRWIDLGFIQFEPSEMMKLALPMMVCWWLHQQRLPPTPQHTLMCFGFIALPVALVLKQPDLGTAILLIVPSLTILFLSGLSWRWIMGLVTGLLASIPLTWRILHDYQKQRILMFLNPQQDPLGHGYHIIQSKIAIGSGGLWGKGWLMGTQAHLQFLPEHATDFIFALWAEEFGLIGVLILLSFFTMIVIRMLTMSIRAQNSYRRLLSASIAMMFFIACIVNIGMVCGILPVVGVPLTLVSFGGTSMVTMMAAFGMIMSIHAHRNLMTR